KAEEDYETILSNLALDIQKRQVKLSEIRLRERRATLLVTLYALAAWGAYVSLWYFGVLSQRYGPQQNGLQRALTGAPVVVGPIFINAQTASYSYGGLCRYGTREKEMQRFLSEKTLQQLMKQQRTKVEEIKKKTNYYTTRDLLQRFDESPGLRQRVVPAPTQPSTPQRPLQSPNGKPVTPHPNSFQPQPGTPIVPVIPRKQWYDKVADALLGDDDHTPNASSSRYALICEKCFAHNGLVKESMWADAQYVCPKCNHFNRSHNSKKQGKIIVPTPSSSKVSPSPRPIASPSTPIQIQKPKTPDSNSRAPDTADDADVMDVDGS
ncbi:hypothetical protein H0H93_009051, partial [Arthromyces matolae]